MKGLKKWITWIVMSCQVFSVTACGKQEEQPVSEVTPVQSEDESEETVISEEKESGKILIAYFSWADNTVVENEEAAVQSALSHYDSIGDRDNYEDADVISSASVVAPGNTAKMAQWIQEYIGGDLFSIQVKDSYPDNYDECMDRAADEKAENARPELATHLDNLDDYDVVFLGFPNWWSTTPMAVLSFVEEYDFSGKTVVPFCAHGTGGIAASVRDLTADLPDSVTMLEPLGVYRADINQAQETVDNWLEELGFQQQENAEKINIEEPEDTVRKLKMTVDGQKISVTLYDTPAANALYEMLPLELSFEDFNGIEKISYLSQELPTEGEPDGCDPDVGDLCLYAPWGNLSVFYQDFRYSDDLILLGHVDSGMELLAGQNEDFSVTLESAEE